MHGWTTIHEQQSMRDCCFHCLLLSNLVGISHHWLLWSHPARPVSFTFPMEGIWLLLPVLLSLSDFCCPCVNSTLSCQEFVCASLLLFCVYLIIRAGQRAGHNSVDQSFGVSPSITIISTWFVFVAHSTVP